MEGDEVLRAPAAIAFEAVGERPVGPYPTENVYHAASPLGSR